MSVTGLVGFVVRKIDYTAVRIWGIVPTSPLRIPQFPLSPLSAAADLAGDCAAIWWLPEAVGVGGVALRNGSDWIGDADLGSYCRGEEAGGAPQRGRLDLSGESISAEDVFRRRAAVHFRVAVITSFSPAAL
jgi:hypothetical protein